MSDICTELRATGLPIHPSVTAAEPGVKTRAQAKYVNITSLVTLRHIRAKNQREARLINYAASTAMLVPLGGRNQVIPGSFDMRWIPILHRMQDDYF